MRINEVTGQPTELVVQKDDEQQTTLQNPKTKVTTIIPKDPTTKGKISADPKKPGQFVMNPDDKGGVNSNLKTGSKVIVPANNNNGSPV